jgi:ribonuclease HII
MRGMQHLECGIDEAGRGPLAGPVYAAAVILNPLSPIEGLADSKTLSAKQRERLAAQIISSALDYCVASASVEEIDSINILQATMLAMQRAHSGLKHTTVRALVDGNRKPKLACEVQTIIKGDATVPAISAASILAKCARDAYLFTLDQQFPLYGFAQHKGYGTKFHMAALAQWGATEHHRRSFAPVRKVLL